MSRLVEIGAVEINQRVSRNVVNVEQWQSENKDIVDIKPNRDSRSRDSISWGSFAACSKSFSNN